MDVIDEFDINIIKIGKDGRMAYSAIAATLKYQIRWCTSASIVYGAGNYYGNKAYHKRKENRL
jgi:hypothetical protein